MDTIIYFIGTVVAAAGGLLFAFAILWLVLELIWNRMINAAGGMKAVMQIRNLQRMGKLK